MLWEAEVSALGANMWEETGPQEVDFGDWALGHTPRSPQGTSSCRLVVSRGPTWSGKGSAIQAGFEESSQAESGAEEATWLLSQIINWSKLVESHLEVKTV